jgi:hypothetical protein
MVRRESHYPRVTLFGEPKSIVIFKVLGSFIDPLCRPFLKHYLHDLLISLGIKRPYNVTPSSFGKKYLFSHILGRFIDL